ncbi:putative receptor protein kinase ZmPK1 [Miscanthus floridulus]|uniref:putative receptor protein kinase ZmPK1 n=1 Tax=Miscanthus floridulus TaxID=154761 RepID=UPI00345991DE
MTEALPSKKTLPDATTMVPMPLAQRSSSTSPPIAAPAIRGSLCGHTCTGSCLVVEAVIIGLGCWLFSRRGLFRPSRVWAIEEGYKLITSNFQRYTYSEIKRATGDFTAVIGSGGSGVVYKGILEDDRVVAVKVLKNVSQSEQEFQSELSVIGRIYHMNLVRMWGCCSQGKHRILVSEYIENGSLAEMLFHREREASELDVVLGWDQRFRIALGFAKGLAYLHSECLEWIIHCDMKPENILLDKELEPKITDFGLGNRGYMAPEWVSSLPITEKVDVYSYGVVLLELVKGVRISEWVIHGVRLADTDTRMVVKAVQEKMEIRGHESCVEDLIDHRLNGEFNHVQAMAMIKVAVSFLEQDRGKRPNMSSVLQALMSVEDETTRWSICLLSSRDHQIDLRLLVSCGFMVENNFFVVAIL